MSRKRTPALVIITCCILVALVTLYLRHKTVAVLNPQGVIANKERSLIVMTILLSLVVVLPVFGLVFFIAWKYRASNTKPKRYPDWDGNRWLEITWWLIPLVIISVLAVITWRSTHELDPYKSLASNVKPLTVQVVALDWKWLFIYPQQHIASVNYVSLPINTPVDFQITADAPMNSFWIPQLAGQIYAMPGMSSQLHVMASKSGNYRGRSANISGKGFAGMQFTAHATTPAAFAQWVTATQQGHNNLSLAAYNHLSQPSENNPVSYYASSESGLYDTIVMKYMKPSSQPKQADSSTNTLHKSMTDTMDMPGLKQ